MQMDIGNAKKRSMDRLHARSGMLILMFASTVAFAPAASAIELVVHASMVNKALREQVFRDHGRYYLQRPSPCNDPYLEDPTVSFKQGRIYVGAHFAGRVGALIGGVCKSATEPSAVMISGRPVLRGQKAVLEDLRVEHADKPMVAAAVQSLIGGDSRSPIRIDFADAIRTLTIPAKTAPYTIVVRSLELSNLSVQDEELHVTVEGAVEVR
jgi:hypothetical protein